MTLRTLRHQLLTVPNLLSLLRIALIPGIVLMYAGGNVSGCVLLLLLSGMTDLMDGWIARRFDAVSDVGKVLDPIADKLTLTAVLAVLVSAHRVLALPLMLLVIREVMMGVSGAAAVAATSSVPSARWHGKATTAFLYATILIHILWKEIPHQASNIMATACMGMMAFSMICYIHDNVRRIRAGKEGA